MYLEVHAELGYPCLFEFRILYQSNGLQVPKMEVKAQSMREQLRVEYVGVIMDAERKV